MYSSQLTEPLISTTEIIKKVNFGSRETITDQDGFYNMLYLTTSLIDGLVYIGVHRSKKKPEKDSYLGSGISGNKNHKLIKAKGKSFKSHFEKYGRNNFIREDLLFFESYEQATRAEVIVVDKEFVQHPATLNICLGGGNPPVLFGKEHGNFGNRWSEEKKKEFSNYIKLTRDNKSSKNPNSKKMIMVDCWSENYNTEVFPSMTDVEKKLGYCKSSASSMLSRKQHMIVGSRYFLITYKRYQKISKPQLIEVIYSELSKRNNKHLIVLNIKRGIIQNNMEILKAAFPGLRVEKLKAIMLLCMNTPQVIQKPIG